MPLKATTEHPVEAKAYVLGALNKTTRLVAEPTCITIQKRVQLSPTKHVWRNKYYYADIIAAIRGYINYLAHKDQRLWQKSKATVDLLDYVDALDKKITIVGELLTKQWAAFQKDPITASFLQIPAESFEESFYDAIDSEDKE